MDIFDEICENTGEFNKTSSHDFLIPSKTLSQFSFDKDVVEGEAAEKYVKDVLTNKKMEVKRDKWALKSGNLCLEFQSRGKPSGIEVTKSDFWSFVIGDIHFITFPTKFLKWIHSNNYGQVRFGGDRNENGQPTSSFRLIHFNKLIELFQIYNESK